LKLKEVIAKKAKERVLAGKADPVQNSAQGKTRDNLAKMAQVSHDTISKVEIIEREAAPEVNCGIYTVHIIYLDMPEPAWSQKYN